MERSNQKRLKVLSLELVDYDWFFDFLRSNQKRLKAAASEGAGNGEPRLEPGEAIRKD